MFNRICIPKLTYLGLPAILLLLSACSTQAEVPAANVQAPTNVLVTTATPESVATADPTSTTEPSATPEPIATPLSEIPLDIDLPEGDAVAGAELSLVLTCRGCHNPQHPSHGPQFGPDADIPGILERGEVRIAAPDYAGRATTNQDYIIESVYLPDVYILPGEWRWAMPTDYLDKITNQELADLLAWMAQEAEPTAAEPTEAAERPDITVALLDGDAERGKKLALKWRCITCHVTNETGPRLGAEQDLPAMIARAELHIADAAYTGFVATAEEYLIEAVIDPSVYIAEGEWEYKMDDIYG